MQEDARETIRQLAALAGLPMSEERIEALALILPVAQAGIAAIAAVDYGDIEPATRFGPRRERQR